MLRSTPSQAIEIIEREMKEQTGTLILSDCGLTEIPREVFGMEWLTELIITNNYDTTKTYENTKDLADPNHIAEIPFEISQLQKLKKLRIGPSGTSPWNITEIDALAKLSNLEELDLSNNRITKIYPLENLIALKSLNLSYNDISEIDTLQFLKELKILNLSSNQIQQIGVLGELQNLEEVYLESNRIKELFGLHMHNQLRVLRVGNNELTNLSGLDEKPALRILSINNNQISFIHELDRYTRLEELNIANNPIYDIHALGPLGLLIKLRFLNISGLFSLEYGGGMRAAAASAEPNTEETPQLFYLQPLTGLQELHIRSSRISDVSFLKDLTFLKILDCEGNLIKDISPIANLIHLRDLNLNYNQIEFIEPLTNLHKLETLQLNENPIVDVPPEVWQTNDMEQIRAHFEGTSRDTKRIIEQDKELEAIQKKRDELQEKSTQIKQEVQNIQEQAPPEAEEISIESEAEELVSEELEAAEKEQEAIEKELEKTEKELQERIKKKKKLEDLVLSDVKLIFVGNSGVGKTQLSKYFENNKLDKKRESTHGIRLNRWLPQGKVSPAFEELKDKVAVNIWDFGGQEYYHGTFRLFLSNYAVYVLLWDAQTNHNQILSTEVFDEVSEDLQHYDYRYWLDNIRHYAPTSPVILLQNKVDRDPKEQVDTEWIKDYKISGDHYLSLHEAAKNVNTHYKWSFDLFCENLSRAMRTIPEAQTHWRKSIAWIQIRDAVVEASTQTKKNPENPFSEYLETGKQILIDNFEKACKTIEPELTDNELNAIPRWLHNSGVIIYFHQNDKLKERVYLNPSWVTQGIYTILSDTVRANNGVFNLDHIPNPKRGEITKKTAIELMKEMEIIFEQTEEKDGEKILNYVAPQYLPETHPVEDLYAIAARGLQQKAFFVRLPLYYFRKVLQRLIFFYGMSQDVDAKYYWKKGILFEKKGTRVMFKGIPPASNEKHGIFLIGAEPIGPYRDIQKELFHIIIEILEEKELSKIFEQSSNAITSEIEEKSSTPSTPSGIYHRPNNWTTRYDTEEAPRWLKHLEVSIDSENFAGYLDLCQANRKESIFIQSNLNNRLRIHDFELLLDQKPKRPLKVFFSYSHKDTAIMNQMAVHLAPLKRLEKIEVWSDKAIQAGDEWDAAINDNLRSSDIVLFLVSADFIASSYIWEKEIPLAIKLKNDSNERVSRVIPIYLRPFDFSELSFAETEMVPKDASGHLKAISQWENMDEAFMEVARRIREVIDTTV
jgi:internalin A